MDEKAQIHLLGTSGKIIFTMTTDSEMQKKVWAAAQKEYEDWQWNTTFRYRSYFRSKPYDEEMRPLVDEFSSDFDRDVFFSYFAQETLLMLESEELPRTALEELVGLEHPITALREEWLKCESGPLYEIADLSEELAQKLITARIQNKSEKERHSQPPPADVHSSREPEKPREKQKSPNKKKRDDFLR